MDLKLILTLIGLVFAASTAEMAAGLFRGSPSGGVSFALFGIQVTLYCTPDGNMVDRNTPPFGNADVMVTCGDNEIIVKGITNNLGFSYSFANPESVKPFSPLQSNCDIVVNTTLSACNSTLPSVGGLRSGIKFVGTSLIGNVLLANFAPKGFLYDSSI